MRYITSVTEIRHIIAACKAMSGQRGEDESVAVWAEADVLTASGRTQTLVGGVHGPYRAAGIDLLSPQEDAEMELFDELRGFGINEHELQTAPLVHVDR